MCPALNFSGIVGNAGESRISGGAAVLGVEACAESVITHPQKTLNNIFFSSLFIHIRYKVKAFLL
jgi:hypothetical protein